MANRKLNLLAFAAALLALGSAAFYFWAAREAAMPPEMAKLKLAMVRNVRSAPMEIALENGYFREEGLEVTTTYSDAGWRSLKELLEGRADIATVAETAVVFAAFDKRKYTATDRPDFAIIAEVSISHGNEGGLARKDRGILTAADLRGKTVGLPSGGTTADFAFGSLLIHHGFSESELKIVRMEVAALGPALEKGEVDAVFFWETLVKIWRNKLGAKAVTLLAAPGYTPSWLLVALKAFATQNRKLLVRFLRATERGERFVQQYPARSLDILAKRGVDGRDVLAELWPAQEFSLSLNQALLLSLEYEARWMIRKKLTDKTSVPDFLDFIDIVPLTQVKPASVEIVK